MAKPKQSAKEAVLPHSKAKLDLYKNYLMHYLRVLTLTPYCSKINLFDIYCGVGLYPDGNPGSPLITNNAIRENNQVMHEMGKSIKPVELYINDLDASKIANVKSLLNSDKLPNCTYNFYNTDADEMLTIAAAKLKASGKDEKSLVFIDPYGYSQIQRDKIYDLVVNNKTEVLLFLPVMQMYRFKDIAMSDPDRLCYEDLRNFIFSFFNEDQKLRIEGANNIFDFIFEIKRALSFGNSYFSCSHYIQRDKGNYYALFFITANMYGLEKMVEAKWKLDPIKGSGFNQHTNPMQEGLFAEEFQAQDHRRHLVFLKEQIVSSLKTNKLSNTDLYSLALRNEFLPMHCKSVLKELISDGKVVVVDLEGNKIEGIDAGYLNYTHYKSGDRKYFIQNRR